MKQELFRYGLLSTAAGLMSAVGLLSVVFKSLPTYPQNVVLDLLERIAATTRDQLESLVTSDEDARYKWEIIDLVIAIMVGIVRHGLIYHPKGFDAINEYECIEWLRSTARRNARRSPLSFAPSMTLLSPTARTVRNLGSRRDRRFVAHCGCCSPTGVRCFGRCGSSSWGTPCSRRSTRF